MANKQVRVVGKRRAEIDVRRLAEALLDYLDSLSETEKRKLRRGGESGSRRLGRQPKPKRSAA